MESQVAAVVNPTSSTSDAQPLELASNGTTQGDSDATQTQTQPATGSVAKTSAGSPDSTPVKDVSVPEKKIDAKQLGQVNFRNLKKTNEGESKGKDSPAPKATSGESSKTPAKKDEVKKSPSTPAAKDNKPDVKKQDTEKKPTAVKEDVKKEPAKAKADSPTTPAKKDAAKSGDDMPLSALVKKETPAAKTPAKSTEKSAETKTPAKSNDKPAVKAESTNGAAKKDDDTPLLDLVAQEKSPAKPASKPATPAPKAKPTPKSTPKRKNVVLSESSESESESESGSTSESGSESESESESESDSSSSEEVKKKTPVKKTPVKKSIKVPENKKRKKQDESSSSESDSESDSESEEEPPKKKAKTNSGKSVAKKETKSKSKGKKSKKNDVKWTTLEHNGVNFPPAYIAHGVKMKYDGKEVELTPLQEEFASYFAKYLETTHIEKPQFAKNFFADWLKLLNPKGTKKAHVIQKYELCDFAPILKYLKEQQEKRKSRGKEEKAAEKKEKDRLKEIYGVATVDGRKESLGNWTIEPPGLFLGRGNHPKAGMIKHRVQPEDVTLNLSKDAKTPDAPEGHKWGSIVHDNTVAWIATWKENIKGDNKYVLFAPSSSIRSNKDREKFETARRLKNCVGKIRKQIEVDLTSKDEMIRQRATAVWIIDRLALRVGNEKNKDEEADTVGCCSLRVEHIKLHPPTTVEFEFLGKDSMRYHNSVQVDEQVFKNLQAFCKSKKGDEDIFDRLTTHSINRYLSDQMEGLTAKVFRTYNASITLENELGKLDEKKLAKMTPEQKLIAFNDANRQVAILCNHQKTVAKNIGEQMQRIDDKINELKDQRKELKDQLKSVNGGSDKKGKKRKRDEVSESSDEDESPKKKAKKSDDDSPKKKKLPTDPEKIKAAIEKIEARIKATELRKQDKDANKEIALGTSKTNYIDPRIVISWCKKMNLSINKVFTKTIREKFPWAFEEVEKESEYEF